MRVEVGAGIGIKARIEWSWRGLEQAQPGIFTFHAFVMCELKWLMIVVREGFQEEAGQTEGT